MTTMTTTLTDAERERLLRECRYVGMEPTALLYGKGEDP